MKRIMAWFRRRRQERINREHAAGVEALKRAMRDEPWRVRR